MTNINTASLQALANFTYGNLSQSKVSFPQLPVLTDQTPAGYVQDMLVLPAAGVSVALPVPASWTHVGQVVILNADTAGYCVVQEKGSTIALDTLLVPSGGMIAKSLGVGTPAGETGTNPAQWTLRSCDLNGVVANGVATLVYVYLTGY